MDNIDELLEDKFLTATKFSMDIETMVKDSKHSINYIDAIVHYCEKNEIEFETVPKLLSKPLKEKLREDAMRLNFMKRITKGVLPI